MKVVNYSIQVSIMNILSILETRSGSGIKKFIFN
jgi:hypothetical protein